MVMTRMTEGDTITRTIRHATVTDISDILVLNDRYVILVIPH